MNLDSFGKAVAVVGKAAETLDKNESFKKLMFGTYSDGKSRNLVDALYDEELSPKQKKKKNKKKGKNKKKKKKKKHDKLKL
jgi:hypothetical protein